MPRAVVPTYSTTVGSAGDDVVLKLEVGVEDGGVELCFAVEAVADALPVGCCFGHGHYSIASSHSSMIVHNRVE